MILPISRIADASPRYLHKFVNVNSQLSILLSVLLSPRLVDSRKSGCGRACGLPNARLGHLMPAYTLAFGLKLGHTSVVCVIP